MEIQELKAIIKESIREVLKRRKNVTLSNPYTLCK